MDGLKDEIARSHPLWKGGMNLCISDQGVRYELWTDVYGRYLTQMNARNDQAFIIADLGWLHGIGERSASQN